MKKKWKCIVGGLIALPCLSASLFGLYIVTKGIFHFFVQEGWLALISCVLVMIIFFAGMKGIDLIEQCIEEHKNEKS